MDGGIGDFYNAWLLSGREFFSAVMTERLIDYILGSISTPLVKNALSLGMRVTSESAAQRQLDSLGHTHLQGGYYVHFAQYYIPGAEFAY